jgi:hypothetical protein
LFFASLSLGAQNELSLTQYEAELKPLMDLMYDSPTDNERFNSNEKLIAILEQALQTEGSFSYDFTQLNRLSILRSEDNKFRIFTWAVMAQNGQSENFGFIQFKSQDEEGFTTLKLEDKSDDIFNPEYNRLSANNWFGCVYYKIITNRFEGKNYYTLLGYDANDIYTSRKVIEPLSFSSAKKGVEFGAPMFYKDKDRRRYIFEYNSQAPFVLKWDDQYYESKESKEKNSVISKLFSKKEYVYYKGQAAEKVEKEWMIVYEVLAPIYDGISTMKQFYVPSEQVNGFKFEKGKWRFIENILPRNKLQKNQSEPQRKLKGEAKRLYSPN